MNPAKCDALDCIHFPAAAQRSFTCQEAARCQQEGAAALPHDTFTRRLQREPPDTAALGQETRDLAQLAAGTLVLDNITRDKPYARKMERLPATGGVGLAEISWYQAKSDIIRSALRRHWANPAYLL